MVRFVPYRRASSETPHSLLVARTGPPILSWSCGGNRLRLIRASSSKSNSVRLHGVKGIIGWWFILFQLIGRCGWQCLQQVGALSLLLALIPSGASAQQADDRAQSQSAAQSKARS